MLPSLLQHAFLTSTLLSLSVFTTSASAQTTTACNPTLGSCPADTALGKSINATLTSASPDFDAQTVTYGTDGANLVIAESGQKSELTSKWHIMFGSYTVRIKAAPGQGIVTSIVLQSDDLDEIDYEWTSDHPDQVQSNYFGKGRTTSYDRFAWHGVRDPTVQWHDYGVIWTQKSILWQIDGTTVRTLNADDARGQFPQTPCQLKIGIWSGGDAANKPDTIAWAGGLTDYSKGPFAAYVLSVAVTDFSTGSAYSYSDRSGDWTSITAVDGAVNGNAPGGGAGGGAASSVAVVGGSTGSSSSASGASSAGTGPCVWAARCSDGASTVPRYSQVKTSVASSMYPGYICILIMLCTAFVFLT